MAPTSSVPSQIAGYNVMPLTLPPLPSFPTGATHYLYIGLHEPRIPSPTAERSLFLVNVPFDATASHLKHLLSQQIELPAGRIEDVRFEGQRSKETGNEDQGGRERHMGRLNKKRKRRSESTMLGSVDGAELPSTWDRDLLTGNMTAIVLFVDKPSADAALKAVKRVRKGKKHPIWGEGIGEKVPALGSARYLQHHKLSYPDKSVLLNSINDYMTAYAAKEELEAAEQKRQRQEADPDGFTTVTRGGRTNPGKQEAAQAQAVKQREKRKGLVDFYRFQSREKRKERAGDLIRKFEEDREKVRKMKEQRGRFKPES